MKIKEPDVRALLARRRKTLTSMARYLGVSVSHVSRMMSGERQVTLPIARSMAQYLGVDLDKITL